MSILKKQWMVVLFLLVCIFSKAHANPIPWPLPASMPLEDMYSFLEGTKSGDLRETFVGNYYFTYIPEEVANMKYPVPPKSTEIKVNMGKLPGEWSFTHESFPFLHEENWVLQNRL